MGFKMEELLPLVRELTDKYTHNESTSVTYETAQQLMAAVLFCIAEVDRGDVQKAAMIPLKTERTAQNSYRLGYDQVLQKTGLAQDLYSKIIAEFYDYGNAALGATITKQIPKFFKWYDAKFSPQIGIDLLAYPLMGGVGSLKGIDQVYAYLSGIRWEQKFLLKFQLAYVDEVLRVEFGDYSKVLANLCRPILKRVLANGLLAIPLKKTSYAGADYQKLTDALRANTQAGIVLLLNRDLKKLVAYIDPEDGELYAYLQEAVAGIASELFCGVENDCLRRMI